MKDENEEMGRELAEGKVHELERASALAKGARSEPYQAFPPAAATHQIGSKT